MCIILVNRLEDKACQVNVCLGKLTALDMTPLGWLERKTSTQTNLDTLRGILYTFRGGNSVQFVCLSLQKRLCSKRQEFAPLWEFVILPIIYINIDILWTKLGETFPASILYKSTAGRCRPVSYPVGPITARYRFIKKASGLVSYTVLILNETVQF